ncbi:hypothetical protein MNBD_GAMMA21-2599 [hydrothermal vent metagenome]|uniref:Molecular chaperone n=1 Tax=hydrothermal vent metagenome TaxID=652676 RepID=A0A3B1AZ75_9ZZZZ
MFKAARSHNSDLSHGSLAPLAIPSGIARRSRPYIKARQLQLWATELPIGNTSVSAHQMLEKLKSINACRYSYKDRLQLHNTLRPVFDELLLAIRQPLRQANIPLDQQQLYRAALLQELLEQMALGYKLIVSELSSLAKLKEFDNFLLTESIYMAILYLSQRLIDTYGLYAPEPPHVWSDLNRLYSFAEARNLHIQAVDDPYPNTPLPVKLTVNFAYKRILLLSLAEPYHLMQYEADDVYRLITSSVESCQLEPFTTIVTSGEYVIDLDADCGPKFIIDEKNLQVNLPRLIDITEVKLHLNIHLQRLLSSSLSNAEFDAVSLVERQQRDMLLRLADAWNASLVRKTERFALAAQMEVTSGLNAAHHYVSEQRKFTPEMDELRLVSNFDDQQLNDKTDTVLASAHRDALQKDLRHENHNYQLNPWSQRDVSPIGISLNTEQAGHNIDVRVGELVTYRMAEKNNQRWQIGVVRWLKHEFKENTEGKVNVGIMNIANVAIPTGTKAIKGLGSGTDYFRSLLIPKQISINQTRSLIVPALLYDVGTVIAVNMKQKIFYAKLTRMLISTRSFTQFDFEVIPRPIELSF